MDALKKLLEQAHALQQAELERVRQEATPVRPVPVRRKDAAWSSDASAGSTQWSGQAASPGGSTQWSGQAAPTGWVDPATQPVRHVQEVEAEVQPTIAERLRDPETLRTFFLLSEAFGPPPGLRDDD